MALSKSISNSWNPFLDIKLDSNQSSFDVPISILPTVRQCMYIRYKAPVGNGYGRNPDFSVSWIDENKNGPCMPGHGIETSDTIEKIPAIPETFLRTKITINSTTTKKQLKKITIFLTTGKILQQGTKCRKWRDEEFQSLIDCVNYFITNTVSPMSFHLPIHIPSLHENPIRTSPRLKSISYTSENTITTALDDTITLIECNNKESTQATSSEMESSSLTRAEATATDETLNETETLSQTATYAENTSPQAIQEEVASTSNQNNVTDNSSIDMNKSPQPLQQFSLKDVEDIIAVAIADTETRVKNELKLMIRIKDEEMKESIQMYANRLTILEKEKRDLHSEVKDLKKTTKKYQRKSDFIPP